MQMIASDFIKIDTCSVSENERKHITICNRVSYDFSRNCQQNEKHITLSNRLSYVLSSQSISVFSKILEYF